MEKFPNIRHAVFLANRINNELDKQNFENALYLVDVFIDLYSDEFESKNRVINSCLLISIKILQDTRLAHSKIDEPILFISKALKLNRS